MRRFQRLDGIRYPKTLSREDALVRVLDPGIVAPLLGNCRDGVK